MKIRSKATLTPVSYTHLDDLSTARARLERVEADICGNFKKLGVKCRSLSGLERLELLHGQLHPGGTDPFRFSWDMICLLYTSRCV